MDTKKICTCIVAIVIATVAIFTLCKLAKQKEMFDPQDMGGRTFFGAGRQYGYSVFDTNAPQQCYEKSALSVCAPGYTPTVSEITWRTECCSNASNYGFFWPPSIVTAL